jgi:predicted DNA-binding ribbon-helix-helix protein
MSFNRPSAVNKVLTDAEHVIRLRGIPSKKSYRLRVLHHLYTHLRFIMEITDESSSFGILLAEAPDTHASDNNIAVALMSKFRM